MVEKGRSPFYPGQPVPQDLFVGRSEEIRSIIEREVTQVSHGRVASVYIQGEYGIGKSSVAQYIKAIAERDYGLHGIYVTLGGAKTLEDIAMAVLQAVVLSGAWNPKHEEKIRNWLSKYISKAKLWGVTVNTAALKEDAPDLANIYGMLNLLKETKARLESEGVKGIALIFDEINGISGNPDFAHFLKGLMDQSAAMNNPVPFLLLLCSTPERRKQLIECHEPVGRIFRVVDIKLLSDYEMEQFFTKAFISANMIIHKEEASAASFLSAGFPKLMHLLGDAIYWLVSESGVVANSDVFRGAINAAEDLGKKFIDAQVYQALRSEDYRSMLSKVAHLSNIDTAFTRKEVLSVATAQEKPKVDRFIKRMKELQVIKPGKRPGEYEFIMRMTRLYLWLRHKSEADNKTTPPKD
mgnify:CR=1 FL=1